MCGCSTTKPQNLSNEKKRKEGEKYIHIYIYTHTRVYMYMYIYVCMSPKEGEVERERASKRGREGGREHAICVVIAPESCRISASKKKERA